MKTKQEAGNREAGNAARGEGGRSSSEAPERVLGKALEEYVVPVALARRLKGCIRTIPDFPKPGIRFRDLTTLFADASAFAAALAGLAVPFRKRGEEIDGEAAAALAVDAVVGIEARGFVVGAALAPMLGCGFVPLRKSGKLPGPTMSVSYTLEYGTSTLEIHRDALTAGARVVLVDDLLATGGTLLAAHELLRRCEAQVVASTVITELTELGGRARVGDAFPIRTLTTFTEDEV